MRSVIFHKHTNIEKRIVTVWTSVIIESTQAYRHWGLWERNDEMCFIIKVKHHDTNPVLIRFVFAHVASSISPTGNKGQLRSIPIRNHNILSLSPSLQLLPAHSASSQLVPVSPGEARLLAASTLQLRAALQLVAVGHRLWMRTEVRANTIRQVKLMFHSGAPPST